MQGKHFVAYLKQRIAKRHFRGRRSTVTDRQAADYLGVTVAMLYNWRQKRRIEPLQLVNLLFKMEKRAAQRAEREAIRPIVEFFQLRPVASPSGAKMTIFDAQDERGDQHPYLAGLHEELERHNGVYIFHDSRGRALYVGKAGRRSLWKEINSAYNRDRSVQQIRRVRHPSRHQKFRTLEEKRRQIRLFTVPLHELAAYLSAYQVSEGLIGELESLLIRGFANDLLNVRMENFGWLDRAGKRRPSGRAARAGRRAR